MRNLSERSYKTQHEAAMGGFLAASKENQQKFWEFAFWVILVTGKGSTVFHYTIPETDRTAHGVKLKSPPPERNHFITAYCHTHPGSLITGNYSPDDADEFKSKIKIIPGITFYLLTPQGGIRIAQNQLDFPAGKTINWSSVEP